MRRKQKTWFNGSFDHEPNGRWTFHASLTSDTVGLLLIAVLALIAFMTVLAYLLLTTPSSHPPSAAKAGFIERSG